jgi:SulP family sulfate permease
VLRHDGVTGPERGQGRSGDLIGGFVAGLYSIPEGIGYASLAGIGPMLGIYAGMVPVAVAAATTGSVLMMSTLTSAIALTMGGVLEETTYSGGQLAQAVTTMALVAGAIMAILGLLRLGRIVNFVSNAVMTGFITGVAVLIIVGKVDDVFGYDPEGLTNNVARAVDILLHPADWDAATTVVGIGTIVFAFALKAVPRLERYALVIAVFAGTAVVWLLSIDVAVISDTTAIPTGIEALPIPEGLGSLPDPTMIPSLALGSFSIAIVALAQGAGIRPAFPNPDGSRASASRDFLGQGLGNVAGSLFQAAPTGGSLSRTAVSADGGARSRTAGYVAAATVVVLVVAFGPFVGRIPEAVIGGLLVVIGIEIVLGRLPDARLAWRTGMTPALLFVITFLLTLSVPLQWAILGGVVLSLLAFVLASSSRTELQAMERDAEGWLVHDHVPMVLPPGEPVVLRYPGPNFFAHVTLIFEGLPAPDPARPGVLVLDVGTLQDFSSTTLKQLGAYQRRLAAAGSGLVLSGIGEPARRVLERTGILEQIGERNVIPPDRHVEASIESGLRRGRELLAELQTSPPGTPVGERHEG